MASILEILLQGEVTADIVVSWLKKSIDGDIPECLQNLSDVQQEFIPFFLNYLRDQTIHLLQNSKSATPSPAKTPSIKKLQKNASRHKVDSSKRLQLFGAHPPGEADDVKNLPISVFSPNNSLDSPHTGNLSCRKEKINPNQKGNFRPHYANQKYSPRCGSPNTPYQIQHTPEQQRSRQKFSLGEFISTPDHTQQTGWKKKSPHSAGRRDNPTDNSPSPITVSRKSGGKKKYNTSPFVQTVNSKDRKEPHCPPIFSLTSTMDFPPVGEKKQVVEQHSSIASSGSNCDMKTSRTINFSEKSSTDAVLQYTKDKLTELNISQKPPVNMCNTSTPKHRRITPTLMMADSTLPQNSAFLVPPEEKKSVPTSNKNSTSSVSLSLETSTANTFPKEPDIMRENVKKPTPDGLVPSLSVITPTKPILEQSISLVETVTASIAEVCHQEKLDILISLYSKCLQANLLPNIIVEFYFLVQLLTAHSEGQPELFIEDLLEVNYFSSIHNTVYFAVSILEQESRLLSILDRGTLKLVSENRRIVTFSPTLQHCIEVHYEKAESQRGPPFPKSPIGSVSFQEDKDNRKNFPSDRSFQTFKRQRDGFYELLREWEASHMSPSYNVAEMFGGRVHALVNYKTDLANHVHFARLFQSQLIAMCKGDGSIRTSDDDENIALLSHLKRTNPEKFKRLQERFIKPLTVGGPCPPPSFPGCQEFFRDFISMAGSPVLNQHLCDTFSAKVLQLNDSSFALTDDDDGVTAHEDYEEREMFCSVLLSVRLVAKFLGFVTFLPYQSPERVPDSMESTYIAIRNKQLPLLDIFGCLRLSVVTGRLTLTVPWVVEYLSMMDSVATRLDYFQCVLFLLLYVHRYIWCQLQEEMSHSSLLIVSLISWLFENPTFPEGFFFSDIPDDVTEKVAGEFPSLAAMDNRNFVDQTLLYQCCPYIGAVKALLVDFAMGTSSKASAIRKITPVSADIPIQKSLTDRQLQLQMEENFFHNHPASMKRVVDFVADRTASNFIKRFRGSLLQESLTEGKDRVMKQLVSLADGSPSAKLKDRVSQVTTKVAQELHTRVRNSVASDAGGFCTSRIPPVLTLLLPDAQSTVVVEMASKISARIAEEKIIQWMNKHITSAMYQSEIVPELDKLNKTINQSQAELVVTMATESDKPQIGDKSSSQTTPVHDDDIPHPSEVLIELKDSVKNLVLRNKCLLPDRAFHLIAAVRQTLDHRQDVLPAVQRAFTQLTLELLLATLVYQPALYTEELVDTCIGLWKDRRMESSLAHIFSSRVVMTLHDGTDTKATWERYTSLLIRMKDSGILQLQDMQENSLKILSGIQDDSDIRNLSSCVCDLASHVGQKVAAEELGMCLEALYQLLHADTSESNRIMDILGFCNNNKPDLDVNTKNMNL